MLPLVSSTMPRLTGTRSELKCVTSTGLVIVMDDEVGLLEARDEASRVVGHGDRHIDELNAASEAESLLRNQLAVDRPDTAAAIVSAAVQRVIG